MAASFTKLFSSITESTVWGESHATRIVWITMLAMADRKGRIEASIPGLANRARVTLEECEHALGRFLEPDKYSRTPDNDGRRIEPMDGGWKLLNYEKYREMRDHEARLEYQRDWDRRHRSKEAANPTISDKIRPAPTKAEAEADKKKEQSAQRSRGSRLPAGWKPGPSLTEWALKERAGLDVAKVVERFRDHWQAAPGSRGVKLDWDATFRNWVRNERGAVDKSAIPKADI